MRKTVLLFASVFISTLAFAQTQKGDIQLSGTLNYSKVETGNTIETSSFQLTPRAGFFLSDNTSIGVILGYSSQKNETGITEQKTDLFQFGVYSRFYKPVVDKLFFFLEPSILFGTGNIETTGTNDRDNNTFSIAVRPGLNYFLSDKLAMEASVGSLFYNRTKIEGGGSSVETDAFGLNFNLSAFNIGASFFLR